MVVVIAGEIVVGVWEMVVAMDMVAVMDMVVVDMVAVEMVVVDGKMIVEVIVTLCC